MSVSINDDWPKDGVKSITSDVIHKRPEAYLAERLMVNREPLLQFSPRFWQDGKYKESFKGFLIRISQCIKYAGFKPVHKAIVENNLTDVSQKTIEIITEEILKTNGE